MNRSFSKIRHIQESNMKLEKRFLMEQDAVTTTATTTPVSSSTNTSEFVYSQNPNPTEASTENYTNYQQNYLGLSGTLDSLIGKMAILMKEGSDGFLPQNELVKFKIDGYEVTPPKSKDGHGSVKLFSDKTTGVNKPFMLLNDVPNVPTIKYLTAYNASPIKGVNDVLKQMVLNRAFPDRHSENALNKQ